MPSRTSILRTRDQERPTYHPVRRPEEGLAGRQSASFICPRGHEFTLVFADDVKLSAEWECRQHGIEARLKDSAHRQQPTKTRCHWDMVLERRRVSELAQLLNQQLIDLQAGWLIPVEQWLAMRHEQGR
jgi:hypothetical protein